MPLTALRACLPARLILWANLNSVACWDTNRASGGAKHLPLNRCRFCIGEWKRPRRDQTLPGFPDAQQNLDPSVVPPAGLYQ